MSEQDPMFAGQDVSREEEFFQFHRENPHVYEHFKRYAFAAIDANRGRFGVWMIWNRMRWYERFETTDEDWKLNNNHTPYYGRMFLCDHPQHAGFFELRTLKHRCSMDDTLAELGIIESEDT